MKAPTRSPAQLLRPGHALTLSNVAEGAEGLIVSDLARAVAAKAKRAGCQSCGGLPRWAADGPACARIGLLRA